MASAAAATSSLLFRRTLLTTVRSTAPRFSFSPLTTANLNNLYRPILTPRFFSNTSRMGEEGVHNLTSKSDWDKALEPKDTLIVLDCFATWCGPCKVIAPQVVKFSKAYPNAHFYKLDVDEVPDVAQELGIRAMPTFLLFKNGEKVGEVVGANPKALEAAIQKGLGEGEAPAS
ncbi:thioredoxin-domain-containing protein [Westerdykella ornata]|uniref:Thioredoxin-domain-containing protein n=1 Tax=Westerdykella ornata TaxID=318751 RepID=A0A6A6J9Y3_WESOR|nr:thioredoxin-domain-containing protein [Westerdykella ornata]KAF2272983.1 thioredoxin-domain-containing protein [Westerdykella ornata]